jgi:hypothetical protein
MFSVVEFEAALPRERDNPSQPLGVDRYGGQQVDNAPNAGRSEPWATNVPPSGS